MKRTEASPPRPRGRPRGFDRATALERATQVFWRQGYEGTSIADLTRAMRINPPSLYAAFGDKEHLYLEAVERYQQGRQDELAPLLDEAPTARQAIERLLHEAARLYAQPDAPRGCMLMLSGTACAEASLQSQLAKRRANANKVFKARIERGVREGELPRGTDAGALADFYATVLKGMALQARDGASRRSLVATVGAAMRAWPARHELTVKTRSVISSPRGRSSQRMRLSPARHSSSDGD
jgi:TetR/AcrR family transcriptional regulator, copper-responsive repressor